ncbi:MAG: LCP family protein [Synechococcaceae cyanobacterium]|nr:LCP family protein [Synechococcaceae cyanobacterium]
MNRNPARPAARPPARPRARRSRSSPVLLAVLLGLGGGVLLSSPLAELINRPLAGASGALANPFAAWANLGNNDVLLLGTDVGGGNTDVIAVLRVEGAVTRITQIPRDTYIESQRFGPLKINALYALGGTDAIKQEVGNGLGRPVSHHVVINLAAIRRMADLLGGIEVDVPKRMHYTDRSQGLYIDLQPGPQTLRGGDLEGFLRFRHDETGDIGRMERQQLALQALFRKLTRPENLVRLPALLLAAGKDVRTDLGPMELGGLITRMGSTRLQTAHLDGRPFDLDGISYWEADWQGEGTSAVPDAENAAAGKAAGGGRQRFLF